MDGGTMSQADMDALEQGQRRPGGPAVPHRHGSPTTKGAITMAQKEPPRGQNRDAKQLAQRHHRRPAGRDHHQSRGERGDSSGD